MPRKNKYQIRSLTTEEVADALSKTDTSKWIRVMGGPLLPPFDKIPPLHPEEKPAPWKPLPTGFRGSAALVERKDAIAALGAFYLEWTRIEAFLSVMLATLMFGESFSTGNEIIAIEVMEHCTTINDKIACVLAAARIRLAKRRKLLTIFENEINGLAASARVRNTLVHGRWTKGPNPDRIKHARRISDAKQTTYTPKSLLNMLHALESKADSLYSLFYDRVVPAAEKNLSGSLWYIMSRDESENRVQSARRK